MTYPACLEGFSPIVRDWFLESVGEPSEPQTKGWPEIASGSNALICAPTGSGKTFAAFLKCLDLIYSSKKPGVRNEGVRIVYISPLKALNNDIYRNLELPINGIRRRAEEEGAALPEISIAVRTGDTPQKDRSRMLKNPPDILITTPESLFIMLTSASSRNLFRTVEYVIVDEIHSICASKRGVHLSVSMERLERLAGRPLRRIGLSATINPLEEAARFLGGSRPVSIVNCDRRRAFELSVCLPVKDLKVLPDNTIWPAIYSQLLAMVKAHSSTLIFVNNRKVAEMVASGLNRLAGEPFVRTHHGSVSKEVRQELERQLKAGEISCLVATSSLELGIDIGGIELVIQVASPGSVSQVLQRIGRSGHRLDAVSKGTIIPKTRGDLLNSAFISSQAAKYNVEDIKVPRNCLDILAQQVASIASEGEHCPREIYELVIKAYPYMELPRRQFEDVLDMLSDPSSEKAPGSVKPRITYDRVNERIRGTALGRRMCLMSGGTIPDKGNYPVYLKDTGLKLGELQEEFVFESRQGERFFLGSSVWRLDKVEKDRVIVSPSTDSGAKIPFWIGDQVLRTYKSGLLLGEFLERLEEKYQSPGFHDWLEEECSLDRTAAENLRQYVADQVEACGRLPGKKRIICEHFSDEVGDRRIIIHSPFGGKVNAPLAVILNLKLSRLLNCRMEYVYNDDGILFHIFGYTGKLANIFSLFSREDLEDEVFSQLPEAPLFNINLRYNLTRSLLVESNGFGKRNPLWIQRIRCAEAAEAVLSKPDHPAVVETYRECMNDLFDIGSLYSFIEDICLGKIQVLDVYSEKPSPFSAELLFNFWQIYQYSYDLPVAERRNQLLVNDRDFIQLAAGVDGEYELIDQRAVKAVEKELQAYKSGSAIRDADELCYYLHSFGELRAEPYSSGFFKEVGEEVLAGYLEQLEGQCRIVRVCIDGSGLSFWITAEDFPLYCKVLGVSMTASAVISGRPGYEVRTPAVEWFNSYILKLEPDEVEAAVSILRRHVLCIGPFTPAGLAERYAMKKGLMACALARLASAGEVLRLRQGAFEDETIYCHRKVYERIKRKTVLLARRDIKPKGPEVYCSFLFERHKLFDDVLPPDEKLQAALELLQGLYLPADWWEDFIFPSRVKKYDKRLLDYLCSTGTIRWLGRLNGSTREAAFFLRRDGEEGPLEEWPGEAVPRDGGARARDAGPGVADQEGGGPGHMGVISGLPVPGTDFTLDDLERRVIEIIGSRGACFLKDLSKLAGLPATDLLGKLEGLVWRGLVSNDSFSVVRYYLDNEKKNSPWIKYNTYPNMGRWYLAGAPRETLQGRINRLLDRYGLISKDIVAGEKNAFKWTAIYEYLKSNEFTSGIKRGFYISGLSGIQFARDRELELIRLQDSPGSEAKYVTLCSCDPANPYKDILSKVSPVKGAKNQGTAIVFRDGLPVLLVKEYGNSMVPLVNEPDVLEKAAGCFVDSFNSRSIWTGKRNIVARCWGDGSNGDVNVKIEDSPLYEKLLAMGYDRGYEGITLWRKSV